MKLNLGCGHEYLEGYDNWDMSKLVKADAYLDIRKDIFPSPDRTYDEIYCSSVLEQVLENEQLVHCLNECWRVLKQNGMLQITVPNARFAYAFRDPHDCRHFTRETFDYFDHTKIEYERYGVHYGYKPWEIKRLQEDKHLRVILKKS